MLALGWIFGATLLLILQLNTLALPTTDVQSADTGHLRSVYIIEGQPPPPCVNNICPDVAAAGVRAVVPVSVQNSTLNDTIPEIKTGNITGSAHGANASGTHNTSSHDDPDVPASCSSSTDDAESNSPSVHSAKVERLRAAYRIAGQPLPPCHNHICPMAQSLRSETVEDSTADTHPAQPEHFRAAFVITGDNQTIPASCRSGKVRCLFSTNSTDLPHRTHENSTEDEISNSTKKHSTSACRANPKYSSNNSSSGNAHFPGTHQTAPITCGDGKRPPCGTHHSIEDPKYSSNHSSNGTVHHFPGTHQTAPITCGDGKKPPCGKNPHSSNHPSDGTAHFSGTY